MQFRNLTALCILLLATLAGSVQARDISMLTVEWAPHYGSELPEQGLTTAIVKAAFKAEGHNSGVDFIPWARALKEVEVGNSDVVMGAYHSNEREQAYIFSDPIYFLQLGLIARPESHDEIGQLAEAFHRMQTSLRVAFKRIYAKAKST